MLEDLDGELLIGLAESNLSSPSLIRAVLSEYVARYDIPHDEWSRLSEGFVHAVLDELIVQFDELYTEQCGQDTSAMRVDFMKALASWFQEQGWAQEKPTSSEPDWPWPLTDVEVGGGHGNGDYREITGLRMCGYRVGKTMGLPQAERERFLDTFFRSNLPAEVEQHFGDEYDDPGSSRRLRVMAEQIARNCRNAKRNNAEIYRYAISDWEHDLQYLKNRYYRAGSFPWPEVEPSTE